MTVNVELSPEMERFINEKLGCGEYRSPDDLMQAALQRMFEDEAEMARTEALLRDAEDSGEYIELNDSVWASIEREALETAFRTI